MITICLLYLMTMVMRIIMIAIFLNLLPLWLIRMSMLIWRVIIIWDFYFRAPGSLVVLSFPQPLNFSSVFPSL
jgi:hypothetical protein